MKCLTLQPPREFAVAWSTPGYAPLASYFFRHSSLLPFSPSFSFSSLTIPGNARHPLTTAPDSFLFVHSPLSSSSAWHTQLWISSALFHPRRTYFNDSRHREARRMPPPPHARNPRICRGIPDRSFASIGIFRRFRRGGTSILKDGGPKGWRGSAQGMNKDEVWTDEDIIRFSSFIRDLISFLWHLVKRGGEGSFRSFLCLRLLTVGKLIVKKVKDNEFLRDIESFSNI